MTKKRARQILGMLLDMHGAGHIKRESRGAGQDAYVVSIAQRGEPYVCLTEHDWELFLTGGH